MMRILIVENYAGTDVGRMAKTFRARDVAFDVLPAFDGAPLPQAPDGHDGMIVLGGGQDALDDARSPWFPALLELMRLFDRARRPVLGICLGAQLLARAHGGRNILAQPLEFGYVPITPNAAGRQDPLISSLDPALPIFQWHSDTFELPPGATLLASGPSYPNQAYRVGEVSYGTQFHFEVDRVLAERWTSAAPAILDERAPGWRTALPRELDRHEAAAGAFCDRFTARWIDFVASTRS
ncbi:type 1 glutamine amidotransferase [Nisaea sp.]|uniref:type 1 glutamine amidotransferase n=1 Tax=Nisaea sp. TaxID=2024842 RepID=UPI003B529BE3